MDSSTILLTEHLSYTPLALIDDVINAVNNLIYQAITSLDAGLSAAPPARLGFRLPPGTLPETDDDGNEIQELPPDARLEIDNGLHALETLLESTVDRAFDKFEIYVLRNIFVVPPDLLGWVRLKHHEGLLTGPAAADAVADAAPTAAPARITAARRRLRETRRLNRALRQEKERNDAVLAQLRALVGGVGVSAVKTEPGTEAETEKPEQEGKPDSDTDTVMADADASAGADADHTLNLAFLLSPAAAGTAPVATHTTFALSQLAALRRTVDRLRPRLGTLARAAAAVAAAATATSTSRSGNSGESQDGREDETEEAEAAADEEDVAGARQSYVDGRVRLHLQRYGVADGGGTGTAVGGGGGGGGEAFRGEKRRWQDVLALESALGEVGGDVGGG